VQTHLLIKPGDHHRELEIITSGANSPVNLTWGSPQGTRDHYISANSPVNLTWGSPQGTREHHISANSPVNLTWGSPQGTRNP
jgi:hypothetical protein